MDFPHPRSEPRFPLGARIVVAVFRDSQWIELQAFTVNVSDHGVLLSMVDAPETGETVRLHFPDAVGGWGDAIVRHVSRGSANSLVGMRLKERHIWSGQAAHQP